MWLQRTRVFLSLFLVFIQQHVSDSVNPNIIFILADDLGWNDVGFNGNNQIPTPNIDALAYTGIILNNYYVAPICTPSRSALMTGKYPIHTGLQHGVIHGGAPYGLALEEVILPEFLKLKGYTTRAVGKWHLGSFKKEYTPEYRGFDSHYGYWTGHQDYYDHTAGEEPGFWGYDMRRGMNITWSDFGHYSTDLFTDEAVKIIQNHDGKKPLFLYLAHLAVHSANEYSPLQAPVETVSKFEYIENKKRRLFAGMLSKLDDSVGSIVSALAKANMLNNSVIIFSTDNGGAAEGFNLNAGSNWPLRGVKDTLWEGGVKGPGLIWSPLLPSSKVSDALFHITDWLPTLLSLTNLSIPENIDGKNMLESLAEGTPSPRNEILLNIDTERKISAIKHKNWKYIKGNTEIVYPPGEIDECNFSLYYTGHSNEWNSWYGPSGRNYSYNWIELYNCLAVKAMKNIRKLASKSDIKKIRNSTAVTCLKVSASTDLSEVYLFDLKKDPCEQENLAAKHPDIVSLMEKKLKAYQKSGVPSRNKPIDFKSNPKYWGYAWVNWMDFL